jgi:hypothetical protein
MLRSAAKNYESVTAVVDPGDYDEVLETMRDHGSETTLKLRERLAIKVFVTTAHYDQTIANFLNKEQTTDASFSLALPLVTRLRYGENPHQSASLYGNFDECFEKLHGKELSFNNILDLTAATSLMGEFLGDRPTLAILKHTNPCGVGQGASLREAWEKAFATDKQAPFGGIIAVNRPLDLPCAEAIAEIFSEVIVANKEKPYVLGTRLRVNHDKIAEIETLWTTTGYWLFNVDNYLKYSTTEKWDVIPAAQRDTRATLVAAANAYLDAFLEGKKDLVPWGYPCNRTEGGAHTGTGAATDSCDVGVPSGVNIANRRFIVDETIGSVQVFCTFGAGSPPGIAAPLTVHGAAPAPPLHTSPSLSAVVRLPVK